jgi:hypothetical protein
MAWEILNGAKSFPVVSSLAANQYCFVTFDSSGRLVLTNTAGGYAVGVLQDKPGAGDPGTICGIGDVTKVQCGGTIAASQRVSANATGQAVVATSTQPYLGIALQAGAVNGLTDIIFCPSGFMAP